MASAIIKIKRVGLRGAYAVVSGMDGRHQRKSFVYETKTYESVSLAKSEAQNFCAWKKVKVTAIFEDDIS